MQWFIISAFPTNKTHLVMQILTEDPMHHRHDSLVNGKYIHIFNLNMAARWASG